MEQPWMSSTVHAKFTIFWNAIVEIKYIFIMSWRFCTYTKGVHLYVCRDGFVYDANNAKFELYPESKDILQHLHSEKYLIAVASR